MDLPYVPRPAFIPFHNRKARWGTLVCHRRSGKTVAVVNDLIIGALECPLPNPQLAYIAPNYPMAKRIAWEYLKQYAAPLIESTNESELKATLKGNRKIFLLGAEKADSLRGIYLDGVGMDEYAQIKPNTWTQVIRPALADRNGWAVFMGTPMGKNHFYDIARKAENDPAWYYLKLKASTSGLIDPFELAELKSQMDDSDFLQEFECSFDASLKGAIYGSEMERAELEGRVGEFPPDPNLHTDVVVDLGWADDTVLLFFQRTTGGYLVHEIYSNNETEWSTYLDEMEARNVRDVYLPHDARAKNLQTGLSVVEQTIKRGYRPRIVPDHKLRDGIAAARKILPYCYFNKPLCSSGVEALKSYRRKWDERLNCYLDRPVHDWTSHVADTMRYLAMITGGLPANPPQKSRLILPEGVRSMHSFNLDDLHANCRHLEESFP